MKKSHDGYKIIPFPRMRSIVRTIARVARHKYIIRGLVEIDVTRARQSIREHKARTGESLSFTAFLAACVGHAVDMNKGVHAYRNWRNQLVLFDDVDINIQVERDMHGQKFSLPYIVRGANRKTVRDIHEEIRAAQAHPVSGREVKANTWVTLLPSFVQQMFFWVGSKSPHLLTQNIGTVELNAIGMFGSRCGWGIHIQGVSLFEHCASKVRLSRFARAAHRVGNQAACRPPPPTACRQAMWLHLRSLCYTVLLNRVPTLGC